MLRKRLLMAACTLTLLFFTFSLMAQTRQVTGTVTSAKDGSPVVGASVQVKGSTAGTVTGNDGAFSLTVSAKATTLEISSVGFAAQSVSITGKDAVTVSLTASAAENLNEIVVIGYGTARKKDLTGSVASLSAKDFNKGTYTSPDQLIQGKVAGVQMMNNSGQPGGASTVKIRGNSTLSGTGQPLYVVDGVPLDGRSVRPSIGDLGLGGGNPGSNPLNFINPSDISSIDILKDASATAIFGSRAAYGVVMITTKKGTKGEPKIEFNTSVGVSSIFRKIKVLNADEFRKALTYYNVSASNDKGANVDAFDAILQKPVVQTYNLAISGGTDAGKYRLSLGVLNQPGIIQKSAFKKYTANLVTNFNFLESKKLGLDIHLSPSYFIEDLPPVTNDAGASGSLIGQALQWNPTLALRVGDSIVNVGGTSIYNPVGVLDAFNDQAKTSSILGSLSPYYKFSKHLEYRFIYAINYNKGERRTTINPQINLPNYQGKGFAGIGANELMSQQLTHTLSYNGDIARDLNLSAVVGYEYLKFAFKGSSMSTVGPAIPGGFGSYGLDYTNYIQFGDPTTRVMSSFMDPTSELQSYFVRTGFNYRDKYRLTATFRADGSTKFGTNNKYAYFPSFAGAWDIDKESFFHSGVVNALKLRAGWGRTGNQEFPSGSSQKQYTFRNNGGLGLVNNPNPDLKWQADRQYNIGTDISLLKSRITVTVDYFNKLTRDLLYPTFPIQPAPPGSVVTWKNLPGQILNRGVEASVFAAIIEHKDFGIDVNANATFIKNEVSGLKSSIPTGILSGQGITGTTVQVIQTGLPINAFFTRKFEGLDPSTGLAKYTDDGLTFYYIGSPNPKAYIGFGTTVRYKAFSLIANFNGAFGHYLYNNTLNNVINVGDINGGRNIALSVYKSPIKESFANPVTASSRFIEKGDYLKMSNVTLNYKVGTIAHTLKNVNIFLTGQNMFVITKFSGFDPEVNVDKNVNGVPSVGIEYTPYPSARTISLGLNLTL